jgi:hypothetical protein
MSNPEIPESSEEIVEALVASFKEVHFIDNCDGTCTMRLVVGRNEKTQEITTVFQADLREMLGEMLENVVMSEKMAENMGTAIIIPNDLPEVD